MSLMNDMIKLAAAANKVAKPEVLDRDSWGSFKLTTNEDPVIAARGIAEYRAMLRDAEVLAALELRLTGSMPGFQIIEADSSGEAAESARLIRKILNIMPGSTLGILRDQVYREAMISGFVIAEEVQQVMDDSEFGSIIGLSSIKVRPSDNFSFDTDRHGNITQVNQLTTGASTPVPMDRCIYYAPFGTPFNPYGRSALYAAYNAWKLKTHLFRSFGVFMDSNASGVRVGKIKKADFAELRDRVQTILERMSSNPSVTLPDTVDLDLKIPNGAAGKHYIDAIREICNKEIRKAILYDESINAEGLHTGSYASREMSKGIVDEVLSAYGAAYAEILNEQLIKRLLKWNGMEDYPAPTLVSIPAVIRNEDPAPILAALASAYQSGVLTEKIPAQVQNDIIKVMVEGIGTNWPDELEKDDSNAISAHACSHTIELSAPAGRSKADMMKYRKEVKVAEADALVSWEEAIAKVRPIMETAIGRVLFDSNGQWRPDIMVNGVPKLGIIRQRLGEVSHRGGTELRKTLRVIAEDSRKQGVSQAERMVPKKASIIQRKSVAPTAAEEILSQDVYMALNGFYDELDRSMFYIVRNSALNQVSPDLTAMDIETELDKAFGENKSTILLAGVMAGAYVIGQREVFDPSVIVGFKYDATFDDGTCEICDAWHDTFIKADDPSMPGLPMHPKCRCVKIPVYAGEEPSGWLSGGEWATVDDTGGIASSFPTPNGYGGGA